MRERRLYLLFLIKATVVLASNCYRVTRVCFIKSFSGRKVRLSSKSYGGGRAGTPGAPPASSRHERNAGVTLSRPPFRAEGRRQAPTGYGASVAGTQLRRSIKVGGSYVRPL